MGFEVTFHYHEEISKGEYNKDEIKTKQVKIGTPYEDVPLGLLAGKIMAQLARRNILVVDVEIYEFAKKQLSYKETSDGILIKNRKFSFDEGEVVVGDVSEYIETNETDQSTQETSPSDLLSVILSNPDLTNLLKSKLGGNPSAPSTPPPVPTRPIRWERFDPERELLADAKRRGVAFSLGKKYPIFSEKPAPGGLMAGMMYETTNDSGKRQLMSDKFFTPIVVIDGVEEPFRPVSQREREGGVTISGLDQSGYIDDEIETLR